MSIKKLTFQQYAVTKQGKQNGSRLTNTSNVQSQRDNGKKC